MLKAIESAEDWITTELELLENPEYMTSKEHLITALKFINCLAISNMYGAAILGNQAVKEQGKQIDHYENIISHATVFLQKKNLEGEMLQWLRDNKVITEEN